MKLKLCDIADVKFSFPEKYKKDENGETAFWATAAILQSDNVLSSLQLDDGLKPMEQLKVLEDDIIIKRINPTYVNLIEKDTPKCYVANNLILVRAKQGYSAKYIAFALNREIEKFAKDSSSGSVIPAISKSELDNFLIEVPPLKAQEVIGELWHLGIEKKKLVKRLSELEILSNNIKISKFIIAEEIRNYGNNV